MVTTEETVYNMIIFRQILRETWGYEMSLVSSYSLIFILYLPLWCHLGSFVENCSNSKVLAMELLQSYTKPSISNAVLQYTIFRIFHSIISYFFKISGVPLLTWINFNPMDE